MGDLTIEKVEGIPVSADLPAPVKMGLGYALKREAVVVKITTSSGLVGYGEAHHCRAPEAVATIVNTVVNDYIKGFDAMEGIRVWNHVYRNHVMTHGTGAAGVCALSGFDMAVWDLRAKAAGWPLYKLLGGQSKSIPAYAGGVSLGYGEPSALVDHVAGFVAAGYTAVKIRIGEGVAPDRARVEAARRAFPDLTLLADANSRYTLDDFRAVLPTLEAAGVSWIEEPFPADRRHDYARAASFTHIPIAAGENHYLRYDFGRLAEEGAVTVFQPDASKVGGVMELVRVAAIASAANLTVSPHTSVTGLNMAATVHLLASLDNAGWFEADTATGNGLRTELCSTSFEVGSDGGVRPLDGVGLGVEIDEDYLRKHPPTPGPAFVRNL